MFDQIPGFQLFARVAVRVAAFLVATIAATGNCAAQDMLGYPREDFGKIALSTRQFANSVLQARIGDYKNEPMSNYNTKSIFARLGMPVGRLDIQTNVRIFPCTGFFVSERYVVTNYHCVPGIVELPEPKRIGVTRIDAVQIALGYTQEGVTKKAKKFRVSPVPVEHDKELDYAILKVLGNPQTTFGTLKIATSDPLDDVPLWIIGHPLGEAQRISREQCKSSLPALSGGRLRHTCDTLPGNSGSPVIDAASRLVVALHHAGSKHDDVNYAIPFSRIVKQSPIIQAIIGPQIPPSPTCDGVSVPLASGGSKCFEPGSGETFNDCPTCPDMVIVPFGSFMMGSPHFSAEGGPNERPEQSVTVVRRIAVSRFEVTRGQYESFAADTKRNNQGGCYAFGGSQWRYEPAFSPAAPGFAHTARHPVVCVSWEDANAYAAWLSKKTGMQYRLLSEAEWEYAARAGTTTPFFTGKTLDRSHANFSSKGTVEVGRFPANRFGLHDMLGNAEEWVADCYHDNYRRMPEATRTQAIPWSSDCTPPAKLRVHRGGSWARQASALRSAFRRSNSRDLRYNNIGFRVARQL